MRTRIYRRAICILISIAVALAATGLELAAAPISRASHLITAAFTYQGYLEDAEGAVEEACDMQFSLYDAEEDGDLVGGPLTESAVDVVDGYFTVALDFGATPFDGEARWLSIAVRCPAGAGTYTPLEPLQLLTPVPYALYAGAAPWTGLTGVPAGFADGVDDDTTYTVGTGLVLSDTALSADTAYLQERVSGACSTGNAIRAVNEDGTVMCEAVSGTAGWSLTGNAGTAAGTNYLGTRDNEALELRVNAARILRLEPDDISPNLIGGYSGNWITDGVYGAIIGGGGSGESDDYQNRITDVYGTVSGGRGNQAGDDAGTSNDHGFATVGGGENNTASGDGATVGGGRSNTASFVWATVGGGFGNTANDMTATVSGGNSNTANGYAATVGGGDHNTANRWAAIGGGENNTASGQAATIGGGEHNTASFYATTVGGGWENAASDFYASVSGGHNNTASGDGATVGGGVENEASGILATVPGGTYNLAQGDYSLAAGRRAKANNDGCFVWGDATQADVFCNGDNQWVARTSGGVFLFTNPSLTSGAILPSGGGSWLAYSSRALKENFYPVDTDLLLQRLARIDISTWNYIAQDDAIRHIGPMADEFNTLIAGLGGESEDHINSLDADGVALAAIQGLYAENQVLKAQNAEQQAEIDGLAARLTALEETQAASGSGRSLGFAWPGLGMLALAAGAFWVAQRREGIR